MNSHALTFLGLDAVALANDCLGESHGALVPAQLRRRAIFRELGGRQGQLSSFVNGIFRGKVHHPSTATMRATEETSSVTAKPLDTHLSSTIQTERYRDDTIAIPSTRLRNFRLVRRFQFIVIALLCLCLSSTHGFGPREIPFVRNRGGVLLGHMDIQSDTTQFGRGDRHLSASLNEGDVVVYQKGTWLVDGVVVGDGSEPEWEYAMVETIQVVWTHNCEHGVIRALHLEFDEPEQRLQLTDPLEEIEFGPEQLIARLPVTWIDESLREQATLNVLLTHDVWKQYHQS